MTIFDELWLQLICTILIVIVIFSITSNVFLDSSNELILVYEYKCLDKKMCEGIVKTPSNDINTEKNAHTQTHCEPTTRSNYTHVSPIRLMDFVERIHYTLNTRTWLHRNSQNQNNFVFFGTSWMNTLYSVTSRESNSVNRRKKQEEYRKHNESESVDTQFTHHTAPPSNMQKNSDTHASVRMRMCSYVYMRMQTMDELFPLKFKNLASFILSLRFVFLLRLS